MLQVYNAQPNLTIINGEIKTTSLAIAEHFGKRHDTVLRTIGNLDCSPEFNARNFAAVEYKDAKGEKRPSYEITRDGFTFLAMGFTGKEAAKWKEAYIMAFNRIEKELINIHATYENRIAKLEQSFLPKPSKPINTNNIDSNDILKIESILNQYGRCGISESQIYRSAKQNFVNQVTTKKILRLLVEEEKFKVHGFNNGNGLKLHYFLNEVEIT